MISEAESRGFTVPVAVRTLDAFDEASAAGLDPRDCSLLPAYWAKKAEA